MTVLLTCGRIVVTLLDCGVGPLFISSNACINTHNNIQEATSVIDTLTSYLVIV